MGAGEVIIACLLLVIYWRLGDILKELKAHRIQLLAIKYDNRKLAKEKP